MSVKGSFIVLMTLALVPGLIPAFAAGAPALPEVFTRFDLAQARLTSLSADFTETTASPLLKSPIVAKGRFYLTKPNSVLWEYASPEPMRFVIAHDEYVGVFPERKRAERRDMKRWSERIFRVFGLGQSSSDLAKYYDLTVGDAGADMKGTVRIVLEPKKRRLKKSVEGVDLWVDADSMLPVRVDYHGKDGNLRVIRFQNVRLNPVLAANLYDVKIPEGFEVTRGFSGLGLGGETR